MFLLEKSAKRAPGTENSPSSGVVDDTMGNSVIKRDKMSVCIHTEVLESILVLVLVLLPECDRISGTIIVRRQRTSQTDLNGTQEREKIKKVNKIHRGAHTHLSGLHLVHTSFVPLLDKTNWLERCLSPTKGQKGWF